MITVNISELREMANRCFQEIAANHGDTVPINTDYYWHVPFEQWGNVYENPEGLTIGQISEDLDALSKASRDPTIIPYSLVWLSGILRAIGQELA